MKGNKILGILAAVLAVVLCVAGVIGSGLETNTGALGQKLIEAREKTATREALDKAALKTAPQAVKKATAAQTAATSAVTATAAALESMQALQTALASGETTGEELIDALLAAAGSAAEKTTDAEAQLGDIQTAIGDLADENTALAASLTALAESLEGTSGAVADAQSLADGMVLGLFADLASDAADAASDAQSKALAAQEGIASVYTAIGGTYEYTPVVVSEDGARTTIEECVAEAEAAVNTAAEMNALAAILAEDAAAAQEAANAADTGEGADLQGRFLIFLRRNWIGFLYTAILLLIAAAVLVFAADKFAEKWRKVPVFSTGVAMVVMIAIQTYALGFQFNSIGEWLLYWFNNAMNVLRANSSVGMIALGMTFVIISGGIDLAVGSTLAGIATVVMCLIDVSKNGPLTAMGVTGLPAYLIACGAGIVLGLLLGSFTGLVITKGRVPPFIVTLGMMQIIRSVAQYFTKSYTPDVPKAFQVLANSYIGGQMLLPIIYWLVLAGLMYVVSKHTAFGRHVYAVGSNERTTMLSGIDTDKVKMKVYILMGFIVSLAAITQVARLRGVDVASAGNGYEMNAIAAVVVGGTSMAGGVGSILGTMLGVLIIGIMNNLLVLLSVDSFLSNAFTGAIVIAAVLMQRKEKNS